jgi:hypothetical protein
MRDAATFSESLSRGLQNRFEFFGVPHQEPFEVVLPHGLKQYCDVTRSNLAVRRGFPPDKRGAISAELVPTLKR